MDEVDWSQQLTAERTDAAVRRAAKAVFSAQPSREACLVCGDAIPQARRSAVPGVQLCVTCQSGMEARR